MATSVIEGQLVLQVPVELLGPGSEYEKRWLALKKDAEQLVLDSSKIKEVKTLDDMEHANNAGRVLQAEGKEIENFYKPLKQQVDSFKKPLLDHEKALATAVDGEKKRLGGLITTFNVEQDRIRREEERKAREEAERVQREEQLARAVELEAEGNLEEAEAVLDEPVFAPVIQQAVAPPKVAGQVGSLVYSATVESLKVLLKAILDGKAPIQCVLADESYLNKKAKLEREGFDVPGVRLNKTPSTHFRS